MMFTLTIITYKSWMKASKFYAGVGRCNWGESNLTKVQNIIRVLFIPNCTNTYTNFS